MKLSAKYIKNMFYQMKKLHIECTGISIEDNEVYFEVTSNSFKIMIFYDEIDKNSDDSINAIFTGGNIKELLAKFKQSGFYKKEIRNAIWRFHE